MFHVCNKCIINAIINSTLKPKFPAMTQLRLKIELNKGRHGVPIHKLAEVAKEAEKFFQMFSTDVHLGKGEWIAENFQNGSLGYDVGFIGETTEPAIATGQKAIKLLTNPNTTADDLKYGIRPGTFLQFAKIASPVDEDDFVSIGLYSGQKKPEMHELSKKRFWEIERQVVQTVVQYGGLQGVITTLFKESNILWIRELSTGEKVSCKFPLAKYNEVWALLKAKDAVVNIEGWITRTNGVIDHLKIESMKEAPEYQEGDIEKFFGCDPQFTGDKSTEDYLNDLRGETTEDYLEPLTGSDG